MENQRIKLTDNTSDIIRKMSEGNPGAMAILMEMLRPNNIDPNNALGGMSPILLLDSFGIYGSDIYVLHSDICNRNLVNTLAVLRSVQLGLFDGKILKDACHRQDYSGRELVPVEELLLKVQKQLPLFGMPEPAPYKPE